MSLDLKPVRDQSVTIEVRENAAGAPVLQLAGVLGHRDPGPLLSPFFDALHRTMIAGAQHDITVDLRELRFMSSASFKHFVSWLKANGAEPPERRYRIRFVLNPAHHWQEVSIHALSCFSPDEISIERTAGGTA
jgi:hypothetical protein